MSKFLLPSLLVLSLLTACKTETAAINGYIEGEYVYVSPTSGGLLETLSVTRGQNLKPGDALFSLEKEQLTADKNATFAELKQAEANFTNLTKGQRPEEINIIVKRKEEAEAALRNAKQQYERSIKLESEKYTSRSRLDDDKAAYDSAKARVAAVAAELSAATLGAREDELNAARAAVEAARQRDTQAEKRLREISPVSTAAGRVEDTYFRPGEYVGAGVPVVSILPPENIKARFFIPQSLLPSFQEGKDILISCDGCTASVPATISFVASEAEFTPPVIYSEESRDKLVFMIEAKPKSFTPELRPGLPIDITLSAGTAATPAEQTK